MPARLLAAVVASVLLGAAVLALAHAGADLAAEPVRRALAEQRAGRLRGAGPEFPAAAYARLRRARAANPLEARYAGYVGVLYAWSAIRHPPGSEPARTYRDAAARWLRAALATRPTWARAWATLAELHALDARPLGEAIGLLERAVAFGPWDPAVQAKVLWIGLGRWDALSPRARALVVDTAARALRTPGRSEPLMALAVQHGWDHRLEPLLAGPEQHRALERVRRAVERARGAPDARR